MVGTDTGNGVNAQTTFEKGDKQFATFSLEKLLQNEATKTQGEQLLKQVYEHYCRAFPNAQERETFSTFLERLNDPDQPVPMIAPVVMDITDPSDPKVVSYALVEKYPGQEATEKEKETKPVALFAYVVKDKSYREIPSETVRQLAAQQLQDQGVKGFIGWESDLLEAGSNPELTSMPAWKRWGVVAGFGSKVLNFDWVQPPLEKGGEPVPLLLFAHPLANGKFFESQTSATLEEAMQDEDQRNGIADELESYVTSVYRVSQQNEGLKDYKEDAHYKAAMAQIAQIRSGEDRTLTIPLTQAIKDGLVKDVFDKDSKKAAFVEKVFVESERYFGYQLGNQKKVMLTVAALSDERWGGLFTRDFDEISVDAALLDKLSEGFAAFALEKLVDTLGVDSPEAKFVQNIFANSQKEYQEMAMLTIAGIWGATEGQDLSLFKPEYATANFAKVLAYATTPEQLKFVSTVLELSQDKSKMITTLASIVEDGNKLRLFKPDYASEDFVKVLANIQTHEQVEFVSMVLELSTDKGAAIKALADNVDGHAASFKPEYAAFFVEVMELGQGKDVTKNVDFALKVMGAAEKLDSNVANPLKDSFKAAQKVVGDDPSAKAVAEEQKKHMAKNVKSKALGEFVESMASKEQGDGGLMNKDAYMARVALVNFANDDVVNKFRQDVGQYSGAHSSMRGALKSGDPKGAQMS